MGNAHYIQAMESSTPNRPWPVADSQRADIKADRPRAIDRYIDYFGGGAAITPALVPQSQK
jgi:hypothetical protein